MTNKTDAAIRLEAIDILIERLGEVDAERFIQIVKKDNFDYTEWRKYLWVDRTIEDIHTDASEHYKRIYQNESVK